MMRLALLRWAVRAGCVAFAAALAWSTAWADTTEDHVAQVSAATEQAASWLGALDLGHYDEAWNGLATVMKRGSSLEDWTRDVRAPRQQLGKPGGRELERAEFATTVRGAPTGNYVTVAYVSHFADAPPILETVLLTFEDERWRVAGYSAGAAPEAPPPTPADETPGGAKPGE
jgi:hypothetical protein